MKQYFIATRYEAPYLTLGKTYNITRINDNNNYCFIADNGKEECIGLDSISYITNYSYGKLCNRPVLSKNIKIL